MNPTRRWLVPATALSAMLGPLLVSGCFDLPPFLEDCQECADCYDEFFGESPPDLGSPTIPQDLGSPTIPQDLRNVPAPQDASDAGRTEMGGTTPGGSETGPGSDAGGSESGPGGGAPEPQRLRERPRVPDAVLRPRPDTGEPNVPSQGYSPPN